MNKYIEAIDRMAHKSAIFAHVTVILLLILTVLLLLSFIVTNGLTLLASMIVWAYIVYKEANRNG